MTQLRIPRAMIFLSSSYTILPRRRQTHTPLLSPLLPEPSATAHKRLLLVPLLGDLGSLLLQLLDRLLRVLHIVPVCLHLHIEHDCGQLAGQPPCPRRRGDGYSQCSRCHWPARPSSGPSLPSASSAGPACGTRLLPSGSRCLRTKRFQLICMAVAEWMTQNVRKADSLPTARARQLVKDRVATLR